MSLRTRIVLNAVFFCASFATISERVSAEPVRVYLKWYHQFQFAGFYAAEMKGYYAEEGLETTIIEGSPQMRPMDAVLSGRAEFGVMGGGLLVERLRGAPLVAVAAIFQHSPLVLLSLEGSGIRRPADLVGRRVMISEGYDEAEILAMLAAEGIPLERLNIIPHSWNLDDLIAGRVDAVGAYTIDQPYQIMRKGLGYQLIRPDNYGIDFYGDTLFTSEGMVRRSPGTVAAFRRATLRGWEYALAHPEEIIGHILSLETARPTPMDIEALRHEAREIEKLMLPGLVEIGHMNPGRWRRMADVYVILGFASPGYSLSGFLYEERSSQRTVVLRLIGVTAVAGLVVILVLVWNYQLRRVVRKRTRELQARTSELEREVQERLAAEAEQRRLVEVLELCPDYVGITDAQGQTVYINRHGRMLLGIGEEEDISGEFFAQYHPAEETERFQREVFPALYRDGFWVGESVFRDRSGRSFPVSQMILAHKDERGTIRNFSTIARDVSRQKLVDQAFQELQRTLVTLMGNLPGMAYRCANDRFWTMRFASSGALQLTGYEPNELIDNRVVAYNDLIVKQDRESVWEQVQQALAQNRTYRLVYRIRSRDGREKWVWEQGVGVRGRDGAIAGLEGFICDISERQQAEIEAAAARRYLHHVIDSLPSILIGVDQQGRVKHWNSEAVMHTGVSKEEALDADVFEKTELLRPLREVVVRAIREGVPVKRDVTTCDGGATQRHYEVSVFPIASPEASGAVIRIDDVTRRLQVEQLMMRSEKMTVVAGLAAGMAHELNNPLGAVLQSVQNIQRRLSVELPENKAAAEEAEVSLDGVLRYLERREVPAFLDAIRDAGGRAAQIVSDMLGFSRTGTASVAPVLLQEVIARAARLVQTGYAHRVSGDCSRMRIVLDLEQDTPQIRCDENKIEQVLLNLINNAAQALREGAAASEPTITIRLRGEPSGVRIEVQDNGPGMSEAVRQRVFEPFFTTKEVGEGTGLGLFVSYFFVVELHGGSLEVESAPGRGACFILRLPR